MNEKPWPLAGYAPGNYTCRCLDCGEQFIGDKRAINCLECAAVAVKSRAPSPNPAPGVVEQTLADLEANLDDAISYLIDLAGAKPSPMSPMNCRIYLYHARMEARRLASLSQPAKGEREGGQP